MHIKKQDLFKYISKMSEIFHQFITGGWKPMFMHSMENFRACSKTNSQYWCYITLPLHSTSLWLVVFDKYKKKLLKLSYFLNFFINLRVNISFKAHLSNSMLPVLVVRLIIRDRSSDFSPACRNAFCLENSA